MGLITAPLRSLLWVFEQVAARAEDELYDEDQVRTELVQAYSMLEAGSISEAQFGEREAVLVQRLEEIDLRKKARCSGGGR